MDTLHTSTWNQLLTDRRPELLLTRGISTWTLISMSNCSMDRMQDAFSLPTPSIVHCVGSIDYLLPCEYSGSRHIFS